MYNIGDKFTIEIEKIIDKDADGNKLDSPLYMMKGFNSLIFDNEGLSRLTSSNDSDSKPNENEWVKKIGGTILGAVQIVKSENGDDLHKEWVSATKTEILKKYQGTPVSDKKSCDEDNIDPKLVFKYMYDQDCIRRSTEYRSRYDTIFIHYNHDNSNNTSNYLLPICYTTETSKYMCTLIFNFAECGAYDITVRQIQNDDDTFAINISAIMSNLPGFNFRDILSVLNTTITI